MPITVPPRKNLVARKIASEHPDLSTGEIAKLAGTNRGHVANSLKSDKAGPDKPKSRKEPHQAGRGTPPAQ